MNKIADHVPNTAADPAERTFGGFQRGADGRFDDDALVECIASAVEDVAGAFGGRNVPQSMKPVEVLGILQGRKWNVAGLNEFRKHFGLKPYEKFEDINSDPEIAGSLRHLYEHPDFVELYPGLVAEEAKEPMVPGVGIAVCGPLLVFPRVFSPFLYFVSHLFSVAFRADVLMPSSRPTPSRASSSPTPSA